MTTDVSALRNLPQDRTDMETGEVSELATCGIRPMAPDKNSITPTEHLQHRSCAKYRSRRWVLAYLLLTVRMCQTAMRQCIGMAIVCMTYKMPVNVTGQASEPVMTMTPDNVTDGRAANMSLNLKGEFGWSAWFEGQVLAAYYYGFLVAVLAGGYVDRVIGSRLTITLALGLGGVATVLTPPLTRQHRYWLIAVRVIVGVANALIDPAIHGMLANWAPISERSQLSAFEYSGIGVAGILTFLLSGFLCEIPADNGWPFVFYFYGAATLAFVVVWLRFARDRPEQHPNITDKELQFILSGRPHASRHKKIHPPWLKIMGSLAVWAIIVGQASFQFVYSWVLAYLPLYMDTVLHFDVAQNGALSSLPFVGKMLTGLAGGYLADRILQRRLCSIAMVRKAFHMAGSVGCAVPVLVISFLDPEQRMVAVVLLVMAVTLHNLTSLAVWVNSLDIAPRYASFLIGITSTFSVAASLTGPLITSAILQTSSRQEWQTVLHIVTSVTVVGGLFFLIFARGDVQHWARDAAYDVSSPALGCDEPTDDKALPRKSSDASKNDVTVQEGQHFLSGLSASLTEKDV